MGLRFRKSIKLGKHTRLNLNKKSFGVSFGGKGARFTLNSKGRRTSTFGIPGTGLSYTTTSGGRTRSPVQARLAAPAKQLLNCVNAWFDSCFCFV